MKQKPSTVAGIFATLALISSTAWGGEAVVAVASNFHTVARDLADQFEASSDHKIKISAASTGKLYAQIINGAPFDIFLAADVDRPERLIKEGWAVSDSLFIYARGVLVLWSPAEALSGRDCLETLHNGDYQRLSIANPKTAPYGAAAEQTLQHLNILESAQRKFVTGENISQTLQFVAAGGATFGFIAASQLDHNSLPATSCQWQVPADMHSNIDQAAVLLERAASNPAAQEFLKYLKSEPARQFISQNGYHLVN